MKQIGEEGELFMSIEWNAEYVIGYRQIDAQHEELFRRFNQLVTACKNGQGRAEIAKLYDFLESYVVQHFGEEESLMRAHAYPEQPMHERQHAEFKNKLKSWQDKLLLEGSSFDLLVETNEAMVFWLIRHIRVVDVALGQFLHSRQI